MQWAWVYLRLQRGARLMTDDPATEPALRAAEEHESQATQGQH
jgi:hypothetical protein